MAHRRCIGTCSDCGKENAELIILDDADRVCEDCLESSYIQCDVCGEYYGDAAIEFTYLDDGRTVCEYCMDDIEDEDDEEDEDEE